MHYVLLKENETDKADYYCSKLDIFNTEILRKRPSLVNRKAVIIQYDKARPQVARQAAQRLQSSVGKLYLTFLICLILHFR